MNATLEASTTVVLPESATGEEDQRAADRPYPAYVRAEVCASGGAAKPLPGVLVELSRGGAGIEVHSEFEAQSFWLRFDWGDWECCFECATITRQPVGQHTFVQAEFSRLSSDDAVFLKDMVELLSQQLDASQQRLARSHARRLRDLRASIDDGSYRPDSFAVARDLLNQVTRGGRRVRR